jgi:hypothetical protein
VCAELEVQVQVYLLQPQEKKRQRKAYTEKIAWTERDRQASRQTDRGTDGQEDKPIEEYNCTARQKDRQKDKPIAVYPQGMIISGGDLLLSSKLRNAVDYSHLLSIYSINITVSP